MTPTISKHPEATVGGCWQTGSKASTDHALVEMLHHWRAALDSGSSTRLECFLSTSLRHSTTSITTLLLISWNHLDCRMLYNWLDYCIPLRQATANRLWWLFFQLGCASRRNAAGIMVGATRVFHFDRRPQEYFVDTQVRWRPDVIRSGEERTRQSRAVCARRADYLVCG